MHRPNIDEYFLGMAHLVASRATCMRRAVGAVAASKENYLISTGYNGVPAGAPHCTDQACAGSKFNSGKNLDLCESIHAEVNAIAHCHNPQDIHTMYVTVSPCMSCMKTIIATGCRRIVTSAIYNPDSHEYFMLNSGELIVISNDQILKQLI